MNRRELNKQLKRDKIVSTAKGIILEHGIDTLTMRYLADQSGVSSRTPYNLFESKTAILVEIIFDMAKLLKVSKINTSSQLLLERLIKLPQVVGTLCSTEHEFYQDILWGIMSSDDKISRGKINTVFADIISPLVATAIENKECSIKINVDIITSHLVTQFLAIIGMWGGSQLKLDNAIANIQFSWTNTLLPYSTRSSKAWLTQAQFEYGHLLEKIIADSDTTNQ